MNWMLGVKSIPMRCVVIGSKMLTSKRCRRTIIRMRLRYGKWYLRIGEYWGYGFFQVFFGKRKNRPRMKKIVLRAAKIINQVSIVSPPSHRNTSRKVV
jgi:hypothetical protein